MIAPLEELYDSVESLAKSSVNRRPSAKTKDRGTNSRVGSHDGIEAWRTRNERAFFAMRVLGMALIVCILPAGCASFKDVPELMEIQNAPGFYPKALYYCGSSETYHYFEQETPLADLTILSPHVRRLKAWRRELSLPEGAEYEHWTYTGAEDTRRQKMRIRITQINPGWGVAEYAPPE